MKPFNSMLDVGMKAMIIGTRFPENSHLIGKVVTVECFLQSNETVPYHYLTEDREAIIENGPLFVVSGDIGQRLLWKDNCRLFSPKYLMPLPPLNELEQQREQELSLCR